MSLETHERVEEILQGGGRRKGRRKKGEDAEGGGWGRKERKGEDGENAEGEGCGRGRVKAVCL